MLRLEMERTKESLVTGLLHALICGGFRNWGGGGGGGVPCLAPYCKGMLLLGVYSRDPFFNELSEHDP